MVSIGSRIKGLRKSNNLTLDELATKIGTSKQTIQRYETGIISNIPSDKIEALADALGSSPAYLMGWDEESTPKNIFTKFKTMTHTVPVFGRIPAGMPFEAIQDCLGDVSVPDKIARKSDLFGLKIVGNSMNRRIPDGAIGVFQKCCEVHQGEVAAVMVNGDDATVKHFTKTFNGYLLEPDSYDLTYKERFIGEDEEDVRIIGKLVWFCMDPNDIK